jgi:hypothetical protein
MGIGWVDGEVAITDLAAIEIAHFPHGRDAEVRVGRIAGGLRGNRGRHGAAGKLRACKEQPECEAAIGSGHVGLQI